MKTRDELLEENRIIHYLMSELNDAADEAAGEWENWANLVDQERVSRILREIYTGMLEAAGKCTEAESKNYINQQIEEYLKMNTNAIKVGNKYAVAVGRNEVEMEVTEKTERGWKVKTASGKTLAINNPDRFIRCLSAPEPETTPETPARSNRNKPRKMSMLGAAVEILKDSAHPMSCGELITAMQEADLWKSPKGLTPERTLAAAIGKELRDKPNPRFIKTAPGLFALAPQGEEG